MALNIKSSEAHELASELARLSGKSMTAVVIEALRAQLEQQQRDAGKDARQQELMEIGRRCAAHLHTPSAATAHGDMLYDEQGLPK